MQEGQREGNRMHNLYPQLAVINQTSTFSQRPLNQRAPLNEGLRQQIKCFTSVYTAKLLVKNEIIGKIREWHDAITNSFDMCT